MMTSVTLPSNSGPIHSSGYSSSAVADESIPSRSEHDFEAPRPIKRCLQPTTPISSDPCKKRRKQSTPVRISAADPSSAATESKLLEPSPESELRCPVCQLLCNDQEHLENHVTLEHMTVDCKKELEKPVTPQPSDQPETPLQLTPTKPATDLPWMPEMQSKDWINPNFLPFNPTNQMFMALPPFTQPETMPPRQQIRIFNPDAYCEMCNKEFCNKYFLKTHKANKHGIYSDPPASETLSSSVNIPSYTSNIKLPSQLSNVDVPSTLKNIKTNKLAMFTGDQPVSEALAASSAISPYVAMQGIDVSGIKTEPKTPGSIIGPYPELFQFQNKLFTKLSKPNIAGLYDQDNGDVPSSSANSSNGLSNGDNDRVANDEQTDETSSSPRNVQCDPSVQKGESSVDQENTFYTSPSKLSPGQQNREMDLSNRYRKIGVMNPKAFCEICRKEYCNKYFLRTHKMKRHGIYIPEDGKEKDLKIEGITGMPWSQNTQTSPLNLIMTEQNNSSSSFSERKTSSPSEISCEQCGIKFQNSSLAQLHNVSVHSKLPPITQEATDAGAEEKKSEGSTATEKAINSADISEDLQKLQTLVLQLNDLDVNKTATTCNSCNKEFENRFYLHAHMMTEHGLLLDDGADNEKNGEGESTINNNTMCEICGKDMQSVEEMKKHIIEFHSNKGPILDIKDEFSNFTPPEKGVPRTPVSSNQISDRRASMSLTPTSSYCEICNKELCNKYFMKTHMQRMHGIEIENGAQIGGVVCDICNKELCSKYFLRVHKHNTHGIVEYGTSLLQPRKGEESTPYIKPEPETALKPADLADLSHRYFTHFTEVCSICSRRFRSTKWLKAHLLSDHGQAGAEKWAELEQQLHQTMSQQNKSAPVGNSKASHNERVSPTIKIPNGGQENPPKVRIQNVLSSIFGTDESSSKSYHCSFCPFTTTVLPFLFVHERSHSLQSQTNEGEPIKCPVCHQTFLQAELYQHHMFSQHPFLPMSQFFNGIKAETSGEISKEPSETTEETEDLSVDTNKQTQPNLSNNSSNSKSTAKKGAKRKFMCTELSPEVGQSLKDVAKKTQLPATYALPQGDDEETGVGGPMSAGAGGGYVMQAFLVDETIADERRFAPSVVFLPVLQRQSGPCSVTFNLTPA